MNHPIQNILRFGPRAFEYCNGLTGITLPPSVSSIGSYAFNGCRSLTGITMPNSVVSIGSRAFANCSSLTGIEIPPSVTAIDNSTFSGCSSLRNITIPSSVTLIGSFAFANCRALTGITVPSSVTTIGESAFFGCRGITGFTISSSVTSLGPRPFAYCTALQAISVDENNPGYSSDHGVLFDKARSLLIQCPGGYTGSFPVPASVTSIDSGAFANCSGLTGISVDAANPNYSSLDGVLFDKAKSLLIQCPGGFTGSFSVPASVSSIASSAFSGCEGLTHITLPSSISSIASSTFYGCTSLAEVEIPDSVTLIDTRAFQFCTNLQTVSLPASNLSIRDEAFQHCSRLTAISLPAPPLSLGIKVFADCHMLTEITIPDGTSTGAGSHRLFDNEFSFCTSLRAIHLPATTSSISGSAFSACTALEAINVAPDSTIFTSVQGVLFSADMGTLIRCPAGFSGILDIPTSIISINASAFDDCTGVSEIRVAPSNPNFSDINGVLYNKDQTTLIACPSGYAGSHAIPASVTTVTGSAFKDCTELTSVVLPRGLSSINAFTFMGCASLESVTIPESVTDIGVYSFFACSKLNKLTFLGDPPYGSWFWQSDYSTGAGGASVFHYEDASWIGPGAWQGFPLVSMGTRSGFKDWLVERDMAHDSDPELDENMDGVGLLMAYALGLNPDLNLASSMPKAEITPEDLKIRFFGQRPDIVYVVKTSSDLVNWETDGVFVSNPDVTGMREAAVKRDKPKQFLKLAVSVGE